MALKVHFKNRLFNLDIHYYVVNVEGFKRLLFLGNCRAGNLQARTIPYYCILPQVQLSKCLESAVLILVHIVRFSQSLVILFLVPPVVWRWRRR